MADRPLWSESSAVDVAAHNALTHGVHGIADTALLAHLADIPDVSGFQRADRLSTNAKNVGAAGNGVRDDTAELQAAINTGDCVIPAGTYMFTTLTYPSGCRIRGAGRGVTVLKQIAGTAQPQLTPAAAGQRLCSIEDLTITAGANNAGTGGLLVQGVSSSYFDIEVVSYNPNYAIRIAGGAAGGDTMHNRFACRVNNFYPGVPLVDLVTSANSTPDGTVGFFELQEASGAGTCTFIKGRGVGPNYYGPSGCRFDVVAFSSSAVKALDWEGGSSDFSGRVEANGNITVTYTANSKGDNLTRWMLSPVGGVLVYTDNSVANPNLRRDTTVNGAVWTRVDHRSGGVATGVVAGPALGAAPPNPAVVGDDRAGQLSFGTGGAPAGNVRALTVTFGRAKDRAPTVLLTPVDFGIVALNAVVHAVTAAGFEVWLQNAPAANQPAGSYLLNYGVVD